MSLQKGDFIFQDLDCGALCDAIERVTPQYKGQGFSHVGIVYKKQNDDWIILEAYPPKVKLMKLSDFLKRSVDEKGRSKIVVGRLESKYQPLIDKAFSKTSQYLGKKYDGEFLMNNQKYYCAELLYDMFKQANHDQAFFTLAPMTFKDPKTKKIMTAWKDYYQKLGIPVPEGKPGINPGSILVSDKVKVIYKYFSTFPFLLTT